MRDNEALAKSAENYICNQLYRYKILTAKPFFDREGADILAMRSVNESAKFIRVQSKGRSVTKTETSSVKVPLSYVTTNFVLFLYIELESVTDTEIEIDQYLYCFFKDDILSWRQDVTSKNFTLHIPSNFLEREYFTENTFNKIKAKQLINLIENVKQDKEFSGLFPNEVDILNNSLKLWQTFNVLPDARMLELFYFGTSSKVLSMNQLIFLYFSYFLKYDELTEINDKINYKTLYIDFIDHVNTEKSIFSELRLIETHYLTKGSVDANYLRNLYIIAEVEVEFELTIENGIYLFCKNNEDEGIELVLLKGRDLYRARHISENATKFDAEVFKVLHTTSYRK